MSLEKIFNQRIHKNLSEILLFCISGEESLKEFITPPLKGAYYAGGTLCLDILFWKNYHKADDYVMEIVFLNLNGQANSTIYGDFKLSPENTALVRRIYVLSKGETDYYKEATK